MTFHGIFAYVSTLTHGVSWDAAIIGVSMTSSDDSFDR